MLLRFGDKYLNIQRCTDNSFTHNLEPTNKKKDTWEVEYTDDSHTHGFIYTTSPYGDVRWLVEDTLITQYLNYCQIKCTAINYDTNQSIYYSITPFKQWATTYNISQLLNGYLPQLPRELRTLIGRQIGDTKLLYLEYDSDDYVLK
jgi:hypothetical protein